MSTSNTNRENSLSSKVALRPDLGLASAISGKEVVERRLSAVSSHLTGRNTIATSTTGKMSFGSNEKKKDKVVVCRDLKEKVMPLLYSREDLEVCFCASGIGMEICLDQVIDWRFSGGRLARRSCL